jgi:hypothetical protein
MPSDGSGGIDSIHARKCGSPGTVSPATLVHMPRSIVQTEERGQRASFSARHRATAAGEPADRRASGRARAHGVGFRFDRSFRDRGTIRGDADHRRREPEQRDERERHDDDEHVRQREPAPDAADAEARIADDRGEQGEDAEHEVVHRRAVRPVSELGEVAKCSARVGRPRCARDPPQSERGEQHGAERQPQQRARRERRAPLEARDHGGGERDRQLDRDVRAAQHERDAEADAARPAVARSSPDAGKADRRDPQREGGQQLERREPRAGVRASGREHVRRAPGEHGAGE